jgi:hypothetical protein
MSQPPRPGQPNFPQEHSGTLIEPGANLSARQPGQPQPVERFGTLIETEDDVRQALQSGHKGRPSGPPIRSELSPAPAQAPSAARPAVPFRPTVRPPVAVLTVFDDGKTDGEGIRIRDHRFTISRTEGDLCIPLDGRISGKHVEITHQFVGGRHRWVVTDLRGMHGTFVRVSRTVLADKAEFLVGNGRYRFDALQADAGGAGGRGTGPDRQCRDPGQVTYPQAVTRRSGRPSEIVLLTRDRSRTERTFLS